MRRAPALPFEAFKFTGTKRPRITDADSNAPINASPPVAITKEASPALPPLAKSPSPAPSPSSLLPTKPTLHKIPKNKQDIRATSTAPIGVPTELLGSHPLRLIIVGHNPSEIAWKRGHYYANPSNWMWRILRDTNLVPADIISGCIDDFKMPEVCGIGFTDVGSGTPGTDSTQFKKQHFEEWRQPFYDRLSAHMKRASDTIPGCQCGTCGAPVVVAFSGKKQFSELFLSSSNSKRKNTSSTNSTINNKSASIQKYFSTTGTSTNPTTNNNNTLLNTTDDSSAPSEMMQIRIQATRPETISIGRQSVLPHGWPLPLDKTEVWVMTSTSGAAAMTREARYAPWQALAERLKREPWPLDRKVLNGDGCCEGGRMCLFKT